MNKMNKKGFTLIEMLVVIAIIAVLVSIIIPTVTSATDKAAAATNAANLRSIKAEAVTAYLTNDDSRYSWTEAAEGVAGVINPPDSYDPESTWKECKSASKYYTVTDGGLSITIDATDTILATYNGLNINEWASIADGTAEEK